MTEKIKEKEVWYYKSEQLFWGPWRSFIMLADVVHRNMPPVMEVNKYWTNPVSFFRVRKKI